LERHGPAGGDGEARSVSLGGSGRGARRGRQGLGGRGIHVIGAARQDWVRQARLGKTWSGPALLSCQGKARQARRFLARKVPARRGPVRQVRPVSERLVLARSGRRGPAWMVSACLGVDGQVLSRRGRLGTSWLGVQGQAGLGKAGSVRRLEDGQGAFRPEWCGEEAWARRTRQGAARQAGCELGVVFRSRSGGHGRLGPVVAGSGRGRLGGVQTRLGSHGLARQVLVWQAGCGRARTGKSSLGKVG
jgi:hypothetical protein